MTAVYSSMGVGVYCNLINLDCGEVFSGIVLSHQQS